MADIAIVIVSYNVRHFLAPCLQSIQQADRRGLHVETWVVDNASVDGSVALVQSDFPEVKLIISEKNLGFSAANNLAIREIRAKYVLLLNPDTLLSEDTLRVAWEFMESHPQAGALGVRMIDGAGRFLPESKRQLPGLWNSFCKLFFLSDLFPSSRWFSGYNLGYLPEHTATRVEVLCGAFMFMRSETLDQVGLLDEAFFMYGEDIDLSYRIGQGGFEIWYVPETTIIHYKGESTKKSSLNYVRTFYGAMHIYVKKHYGQGKGIHLVRFVHLAVAIRAAISTVNRLVNRWLAPVLDALVIWCCLQLVSTLWAKYYFADEAYFQTSAHKFLLGLCTAVWLFFLWLGGNYSEKVSPWRQLTFVSAGLITILLIYALFPEAWRSSRAVILLGALAVWVTASVLHWVRQRMQGTPSQNKAERVVALVAHQSHAAKLTSILSQSGVRTENIYTISPERTQADTWYANHLANLPQMIQTLGINEVVYSSESMTLRTIMDSMTQLGAGLVFRIGGDDSLGIIGSPSKGQQGEWYGLEMRYKLDSPQQRRLKRVTDVLLSFLVLLFLPIVWIWTGLRWRCLPNAVSVIVGKATWVGYGGRSQEYQFLPALPPCIVKVPFDGRLCRIETGYARMANMAYAKDYTPARDVRVFWQNIHRLSNKAV
ncbi:MAG: glycosyltransferase family 2 protein [Saprospiraceae bacterium]|nr:glycosyltransferase family 2 protein [Saprospiraceae bacterium]